LSCFTFTLTLSTLFRISKTLEGFSHTFPSKTRLFCKTFQRRDAQTLGCFLTEALHNLFQTTGLFFAIRAIQFSARGCQSSPKRVKGFCSMWGLAYPARPHDPKPFHENRPLCYHSPVRSSRCSLTSRTCASRVANAILYPLFSPCRAAPCCVAPAARVPSPHGDATTGARSLMPWASRLTRPVPQRCTRSLGAETVRCWRPPWESGQTVS
jgi:hypothetical protein